jgi:hypothetical protein
VRAGPRLAAAVLAAAALAAGTAAGELRSVEAVGAVAGGTQAPKGLPIQQAAIEAGLREAVRRVARDLVGSGAAALGPRLEATLGPNVYEYVSRFQLLEDRGEQPPLLLDDPTVKSEYVVLVSVQVDAERVRGRLAGAGLLGPDGAPAPGRVLLVIEDVRSYPGFAALAKRLRADPGVRSVVPDEFVRGRARLAVETTLSPDAVLKRLVAQPPEGLEVVLLRQDAEGVHLRLVGDAIDTSKRNRY